MTQRKLNEDQIETIRIDYETLGTYKAVCKKWGIHRGTVASYLDPEQRKRQLETGKKVTCNKRRKDAELGIKPRLRTPKVQLTNSARARAKEQCVEFSITPEDFTIPSICPILGIPLVYGAQIGKPQAGSLSLDRIVPSKGYVKGNVQFVSHLANTMKSNASLEQLKKFANWILNN